jgi:Protein of unknown function (DUF1553)/Protein of unknown function (DUF1549)/Planctomycete cytochrome C
MGENFSRTAWWMRASGLALAVLAGSGARAASAADDASSTHSKVPVDYLKQVKPILTQRCVTCHGVLKPRGGLRLDTVASVLKGGKSGAAVVPGRGAESPLIAALLGEGPTERMPLNRSPLPASEIKIIRDWIDQGAQPVAGERPGVAPTATHWSFLAPRRPPVPAPATKGWSKNPIDDFVLARLEQAELTPSPAADRTTLLRRLSLDVIGLPPAPEEIASFLTDRSEQADEHVLDRLFASPQFGERWARPWLDQARYADSHGYSIDAPRSIWKYRDWVIAALNADMPFDEFVIDQIAGDLRHAAGVGGLVATGFHRNTQINQEGGIDVEQFRVDAIVDRVNTTGTVFLGLTIGCAQCHDHKYDPISQRDYYQLFSFFNNVDEPELELASPAELARRDAVRAQIDAFHAELARRHPDLDEHERTWEKTVTLAFTQAQDPDVRLAFDSPREKRSPSQRRKLIELMMARDTTFKVELAELQRLRAAEPKFVTTLVVRERVGSPRPTFIHVGGDFTRKGAVVQPAVPAVIAGSPHASPGTAPDRMDLARWLVDRRNPLTARVVVNRIWQVYFGRGLVETDNDFGTQGSPPSHPELLDWLACELMDQGWRTKTIHRLIVNSATYRQASLVRAAAVAVDPDNRLLWRQARLRLDAELIRDSALTSSGLLTRVVGGPSVFPPQPDGVMTLGQMRRPWSADVGANRYRRGLYTFFWRATPHPSLTVFDAPGGAQACTRRFRSNTPLQALTLLNDPAFYEIAQGLAGRIVRDRPDSASDRDRLQYAWLLCLGRAPSDRELVTLTAVLERDRRDAPAATGSARWISVARVLLNLDEFVTRE